jgi:hypothetical protein
MDSAARLDFDDPDERYRDAAPREGLRESGGLDLLHRGLREMLAEMNAEITGGIGNEIPTPYGTLDRRFMRRRVRHFLADIEDGEEMDPRDIQEILQLDRDWAEAQRVLRARYRRVDPASEEPPRSYERWPG